MFFKFNTKKIVFLFYNYHFDDIILTNLITEVITEVKWLTVPVWTIASYCTDGIVTLSLSKLISRAAETQSRILISVDKQSPIICRAKDTIKRFLIGTLWRFTLCETYSVLAERNRWQTTSMFKSMDILLILIEFVKYSDNTFIPISKSS